MDVREKLVEAAEVLNHYRNRHYNESSATEEYKLAQAINNVLPTLARVIAHGVTVQEWISVKDRLPEAETEVLILASRKIYSLTTHSHTTHHIITTGMYEDGTKRTEDSEWWWEADGFEYDEERDDYIIPEGWWEYKHYNGDEQHNYAVDDDVTHWMPLPKPPKGEGL